MKEKGYSTLAVLFVLALVAVGGWGWVWNILKLMDMCCDISGLFVVRIIGIFVPPLGAIVGFL